MQYLKTITFAGLIALTSMTPGFAYQGSPDQQQLLKAAVSEMESFHNRYEAEVWMADMARRLEKRIPNLRDRLEFLKMVHAEARRANLTAELVLAVIEVESAFNHKAISKAGARGLMQVMPFWLDEIGKPGDDLFHMRTNLRMGCTILRRYLDREKGNIIRALGRYNGSLGSYRYPDLVLTALRKRWYRP